MVNLDKTISMQERTVLGKGLSAIRAQGLVPAVIHNHGQDSIHTMAPSTEMNAIYKEAGKHHPLKLSVDGTDYLALIKDAHYNPVKRSFEHYVFQAIRQNETVEAEIPIRLEGEIPAEKVGLLVLRQLDHVEIEALPRDLPDEFLVDASVLAELHDKIVVGDLKVPEGVTILTEADHPIVVVVETRATAAEEDEVAEGEETTEGAEGEATEDEAPSSDVKSDSNNKE